MKEFIEKLNRKVKEKTRKYEYTHIFNNLESDGFFKGVTMTLEIVNELAEEHKGGWIPCSERLPEPGKRYLVSGVWKDKDFEKHSVYIAVYGKDGLWHSYNYEPVSYEVLAWQQLPEEYQSPQEPWKDAMMNTFLAGKV